MSIFAGQLVTAGLGGGGCRDGGEVDHGATVKHDAARLMHPGQLGQRTLLELGRVRRAEGLDERGESVRHMEIPAGLRAGHWQVDREVYGADAREARGTQVRRYLKVAPGRTSMPIDPKIEQPIRAMLGHAMRHELNEHWWEYLDQMWDATEKAARTSLSVLPALMLRPHKERKSTP